MQFSIALWLALSASAGAVEIPFSQDAPDAPLVHRASKFSFPARVDCFVRSNPRQYDIEGLDVSVTYRCPSVVLTLYVYPTKDKSLRDEFASRQEEIATTHESAKLLAISTPRISPERLSAFAASYAFDEEYQGKQQPLASQLVVGKDRHFFVEYRFTYPVSDRKEAEPAVEAFKTEFAWP